MRWILGIETSCDETSAAVLEGRTVRSSVVASQAALHAQWGGVVPEAAARQHVERLNPVLQQALDEAGIRLQQIDAVAVTNRPGLVGALVVGLAAAKALAFVLNKPLVGVNHLEGHLYSAFLTEPDAPIPFPHLALVVSGGHTELILARGHGDYRLLGHTLDDAAGEAFDKTARLLHLGYPGGPEIDRRAQQGNPKAFPFPRARVAEWHFSFSGLKTAVRREVERLQQGNALTEAVKNDLCASFQQAVIDALIEKTMAAVRAASVETLTVVGGVAANSALQRQMRAACDKAGVNLKIPPPKYCTDNAAMIALAGYFRLLSGERADYDLDAYANAPLGDFSNTSR
ncbi:MAG: tRNA (adenosine(37)-N6)-threonylcarbamoyltransferase complex transferase subunit TsaD [Armatimonadetes bacterium JP3_11]|nr:MAG: tRNA (adenosine(37)-N6)-threonylcarbamoyltransferase complex transferase subunit TsaD [Armatimonadetes bacterium CP1_7O]OYT75896.1 MAG: tRNA (adenosine(37)-N6)-threonylcarbamoyltransferase complex transferase subunit TsaD [Armatimonadetes bacterium JP3_11]RMH07358.1 MAG: tRNA (adenosine(37)-N6)-threonylcarbamoyltransferase complex transferase subunit TsaD [Armatimonadota bacterium]